MTRDEAIKLLQGGPEGIQEWNRRRAACLEPTNLMCIDLASCELCGPNDEGVNLALCDLNSANLSRANMTSAILHASQLIGANLEGAILDNANATGADFSAAALWHASLRGTTLKSAKLIGCYVSGMCLEGAVFGGTTFVIPRRLDGPSDIIGLDEVEHHGPSWIGIDTLRNFRNDLPEMFLRGCGLNPWEILNAKLYDPSLTALQVADLQAEVFRLRTEGPIFLGGVFISYSHDDATFVDKLCARLKEAKVTVWIDTDNAVAGPLRRQVVANIRLHDIVLLVLSESSVGSDWVAYELKKALQKEVDEGREVLCPVALDGAWRAKTSGEDHWRDVRDKNVLDFSKWKTKAFDGVFQRLIDGLKKYYPPKT